MNRWEINHTKGHALLLKPIFEKMLANADCIINFAEILDDGQIIMLNTMMFDLLSDASLEVLNFTFDNLYNPNPKYPSEKGKEESHDDL
jgi:hypothetical protein